MTAAWQIVANLVNMYLISKAQDWLWKHNGGLVDYNYGLVGWLQFYSVAWKLTLLMLPLENWSLILWLRY